MIQSIFSKKITDPLDKEKKLYRANFIDAIKDAELNDDDSDGEDLQYMKKKSFAHKSALEEHHDSLLPNMDMKMNRAQSVSPLTLSKNEKHS